MNKLNFLISRLYNTSSIHNVYAQGWLMHYNGKINDYDWMVFKAAHSRALYPCELN